MKKALALVGGGTAAVALGVGLFAWQANNVTASNGAVAGAAAPALGCTNATLNVQQHDPVWNNQSSTWTVSGGEVSFDPANTACNGQTVRLAAVNAQGTFVGSGTAVLTVTSTEVTADLVSVDITMDNPATLFDPTNQNINVMQDWVVTITP
jgi:hypothetical protein